MFISFPPPSKLRHSLHSYVLYFIFFLFFLSSSAPNPSHLSLHSYLLNFHFYLYFILLSILYLWYVMFSIFYFILPRSSLLHPSLFFFSSSSAPNSINFSHHYHSFVQLWVKIENSAWLQHHAKKQGYPIHSSIKTRTDVKIQSKETKTKTMTKDATMNKIQDNETKTKTG